MRSHFKASSWHHKKNNLYYTISFWYSMSKTHECLLLFQLVTNAELEDSPVYVPLHPFEGRFTTFKFPPLLLSLVLFTVCKLFIVTKKLASSMSRRENPDLSGFQKIITWSAIYIAFIGVPWERFWFQFITAELNEKEVKHVNSDLSPSEQVQQAVGCLPLPSEKIVNGLKPSSRRWTVMDYSKAYSSGEITPYKVHNFFHEMFFSVAVWS